MKISFDWRRTRKRVAAGILALALYVTGADAGWAVSVDDFIPLTYTDAQGTLPYRLFIPTNYSSAQAYPLVVYLHGAGERGSDNRAQLVGQTGALVFASETNQLKYPSFMVAPQCPTGELWTTVPRAQVRGLVSLLVSQYNIDTNRLYITGLSMGGRGTWDYIGRYPDLYAAAIPMSGDGTVSLAPYMVRTPIWNFHAADDATVAVSGSRDMVNAVRRAGGRVIYTEYATGGHVIWTPAYNTPVLMDWVYAQARGVSASVGPRLSIQAPTDQRSFASDTNRLNLAGTATDGSGGSVSVTWTNYMNTTLISSSSAVGTANWTIGSAPLNSTYTTNFMVVVGKGTSWYPSWGGSTTFNDTLAIIFPPFIVRQPEAQLVNEGDAAGFTVGINLNATTPLYYQWCFNGTNIAGATLSSLVLTNVQATNAGFCSVRITNRFGVALSADALLSVNHTPPAGWQLTSAPNNRWCSLVCSADGTKLLAAVTGYSSIYASANSGLTWFQSGAPSNDWTSVASSANGVKLVAAAGVIYNAASGDAHGGPIYTSTNSGATWSPTTAPSNQWSCVASSADGSRLVAAAAYDNSNTAPGLIFISTNSGATWLATDAPGARWYSAASSADGTKLVAGATGIFTSTNSGATWQSNNIAWDFPAGAPRWTSVASSADGATLVAIRELTMYTGGSVPRAYVSTNYGSTWTSADLPTVGSGFVASSADGTRLIASKGHIYTSTNFGAAWTQNSVPGQTYGWGSGCVASSADGNKLFLALGADDFSQPNSIYTCYSRPTPQLHIAPFGSELLLSWIVPSTSLIPLQNSDLTTTNWNPVTNTATLNLTNLQIQLFLSRSNSQAFYRLMAP